MKPSPYMALALDEARAAARRGEVPVGAVLVDRNGVVLAQDGNRILELFDPTAHAELLVLRAASRLQGSERLVGCHLYVTLEPCTMCAGAIALARIERLYFGAEDEKAGAVENGVRFFNQPSCHHHLEIYGGFAERESRELLQQFFRERRS